MSPHDLKEESAAGQNPKDFEFRKYFIKIVRDSGFIS